MSLTYVQDRYNRQLHPHERQWAKDNTGKFAQFYKDQTSQSITADQAQQMLLANGYRIVDAAASKGPGATRQPSSSSARTRAICSARHRPSTTARSFTGMPIIRFRPNKRLYLVR